MAVGVRPRTRLCPAQVSGNRLAPVWVLDVGFCLDPATGPPAQLLGLEEGSALSHEKASTSSWPKGQSPYGPLPALGSPCISICALALSQPLGFHPFLRRCLLVGGHCLFRCLSFPPPGRDPSDLSRLAAEPRSSLPATSRGHAMETRISAAALGGETVRAVQGWGCQQTGGGRQGSLRGPSVPRSPQPLGF